jgi:hypothetical protein
MNSENISLIIFGLSFLGLIVFIYRKIPALKSISINPAIIPGESLLSSVKNKISVVPGLKNFSLEMILHRIISKIRIFSLKTDQKTFSWLQKLREKNQKNRMENPNYWEEIEKGKTNTKE